MHACACVYLCTVVGALLGRQSGREIEVCNSFDLKYHVIDNAVVIDMPFLKQRDTQCMYRGFPFSIPSTSE